MIQVGFLLLLCIAAVTAGAPPAPANPPCVSSCKAASNFDAEKLMGTWNEVRKIASAPGREGTCETITYTAGEDDILIVDFDWVDRAGKPKTMSGTIKTSGIKPTDAELTVSFGEKSVLYTIFNLDYDTAFGVYSCINDKAYVWVFSKTEEIADGALKNLNRAMIDSGLDPKWLKPTPRTECPATC